MRALLLLPIIASVWSAGWSAEYQKLTFSDGRTKTGYLDERKGSLTLDDGSTIAIRMDDIIRREPATPAGKSLEIPVPVRPPEEKPTSPERTSPPNDTHKE